MTSWKEKQALKDIRKMILNADNKRVEYNIIFNINNYLFKHIRTLPSHQQSAQQKVIIALIFLHGKATSKGTTNRNKTYNFLRGNKQNKAHPQAKSRIDIIARNTAFLRYRRQ